MSTGPRSVDTFGILGGMTQIEQTVVEERTAATFERREIKVVFNYRWQDTDVIRLDSGHKVLQLWLRFERHAPRGWQLAKAFPVTLERGSGELDYWTGVGLDHDPETVPRWVRMLVEKHKPEQP